MPIRQRTPLLLLAVVATALLSLAGAGWGAERPNFLLILADDLGYGDVSAYGESDVRTPHLDRLAAEGLLFTTMRANCTVCSPSRAALLTGRYADRVGVPGVIRTHPENAWGYFDPSVRTLADELRAGGYHTAIVGKWHLGLETPNTPPERGFDVFHGFLGDMMDSYTTHLRHGINYMRRDSAVIEPLGHATDLFADWAAEYLRGRAKSRDGPFFLYLAFNAPHSPIEPPSDWLAVALALSAIVVLEIAGGISLNAIYWTYSRKDAYELLIRRAENPEAFWANVIFNATIATLVWVKALI